MNAVLFQMNREIIISHGCRARPMNYSFSFIGFIVIYKEIDRFSVDRCSWTIPHEQEKGWLSGKSLVTFINVFKMTFTWWHYAGLESLISNWRWPKQLKKKNDNDPIFVFIIFYKIFIVTGTLILRINWTLPNCVNLERYVYIQYDLIIMGTIYWIVLGIL